MKCSRCGKEFGNGDNCQCCGVDRVTGLANYSGYYGQSANNSQDGYHYAPQTTACYSCGGIIPSNSQFCPVCGSKLLVKCPNCGCEYSSQYSICNHCGTNREKYLKEQQERERKQKEWEDARRRNEKEELKKSIDTVLACLIGVGMVIIGFINLGDSLAYLLFVFGGIGVIYESLSE